MLKCGSDEGSVPDSWQCVSPPVSPRHGQLSQLTCSGHAHGQVQVERVRHLAQLIDHRKPDTENLLLSAAIRKRELLVLAGLVLLSDGVDIRSRREALVLLRWCAATQPVAPHAKVVEEVDFLTIQAQHGLSLEAKQWAGAGLAMLACQTETEKMVLGSGSARILSSLMLKVLAQEEVDLHFDILAQCGRFITHVTPIYTEAELDQMSIPQLAGSVTERLVMELGGGGDVAAEACLTLLGLLKTQPQAFAAAFRGTETDADQWHGVAAVVAAVVAALHKELDRDTAPALRSDSMSVAATAAEDAAAEVVKQPLSCEGRTKGLAASLLALLRHLLELSEAPPDESSAAATAASAHEGAVSLLVHCLPGEGGADAMRSLSFLLGVPKARADLLSAGGAVDEVASQWHQAPAAAARALWHLRQQPQGRMQVETLLQLLRHPASPDERSGSSCQRYGDALECVKSIETSGAWGCWDQAEADQAGTPSQQDAPQDLLTALDLSWGHLQELPRSQDTAECEAILMELWALLSRRPSTAAQLALTVGDAAAGAVEGALPCCVRAALYKLEGAEAEDHDSALSSHMALLLNLQHTCCARQLQPSWMRQVLGSFLEALHLQLQHHACSNPGVHEPADLEALQLCTQLCLMSSGDGATAQLQPLTPHMLLPTTWTCSSREGSLPGAGSGSVEGQAAPWCPLDVLEAKLGLVQRLMAAGTEEDVLHLLPPQLMSGPLASDTPPPPSNYTPLLNATPDAMRRQMLVLLKQAADAQYRAVPTDCWAQEILDQALDAARSCKGGEPCKQKLANCVAVAALWLDVVLQPDEEVSDDAALDLHQQTVRERLQGMVPWALELLQLLMECTAAANAVVPAVGLAPSTVLKAAGSILELLCLQLHSTGPLPGLSPLESRRWFLPGGRLRAATPEQRSLMTVMATAATVRQVAADYAAAKKQEHQRVVQMIKLKVETENLKQHHTDVVAALRAEMAALTTRHAAELASLPILGVPVTEVNVRPGLRVKLSPIGALSSSHGYGCGRGFGTTVEKRSDGFYHVRWDNGHTAQHAIGGGSGRHDLQFA